jgi:hypothetical protein
MNAMDAGLFLLRTAVSARVQSNSLEAWRPCLPSLYDLHILDAAKMMLTIRERAMMNVDDL